MEFTTALPGRQIGRHTADPVGYWLLILVILSLNYKKRKLLCQQNSEYGPAPLSVLCLYGPAISGMFHTHAGVDGFYQLGRLFKVFTEPLIFKINAVNPEIIKK